ncbi:MAG TPA: DUF1285 domain-containing protein [Allosphingosinicella sp.]|jgi:hypothetical protein
MTEDLSRLSLAKIERLAREQKPRPVERWNPQRCGHSAMRIARDGSWYHEGRPIARPALVRLFASILRRESDGSFVLVTPAEKLTIDVEDAPFLAVEVKSEGEGRERKLAFRLNTGDLVIAGRAHPLRLQGERPYVAVRGGLEALIARPVYYELAETALAEGGVWSGGVFFPAGASE